MFRGFLVFAFCIGAPFAYAADSNAIEETRSFPQEQTPEEYMNEESPPMHQVSDVRSLFFKTFSLLAGLCGLIIVGGYVLKRVGGPKMGSFGTNGAITLIERKYISPKTAVWLVEVNDQPIVIVDSQNGVAIHAVQNKIQISP